MPDGAEMTHSLTDAAIVYLAGSLPVVIGGVIVAVLAVIASLAWLCYQELRGITPAVAPSTAASQSPVDIDLTRI